MPRKTPILLRKAPFSEEIVAVTSYTPAKDGGPLRVKDGGKFDVSGDFYHLLLNELFPQASECGAFTSALDGAARGMELNQDERRALGQFRKRLVDIIERDNAWLEAGQPRSAHAA